MNKELNAAEAVYGFVGWLTTRKERTVMSAKDDCAPIAELVKRFCTENNLPEVSDQWPSNLIHPSGEVAVPNAESNGGAALAPPAQAADSVPAQVLIAALNAAKQAINSMKVEAETAAQGDEQMMLEACETISNEGLQADIAIREALASAQQPAPATQQAGEVSDAMVLAALRVQYPAAYGQYLRHPANGPKTSLRTESEIDTARRMIAAALSATPQPSPTAQAAGSVPAGDVAEPEWKLEDFEVTHYPPMPTTGFRVGMPKGVKVLHKPTGLFATSEEERSQHRNRDVAWNKLQEVLAARAPAESVPAVSDLPPLPAPDLRDVGTKPQEIKEFLKGYATEYARLALAARAPAESVPAPVLDSLLNIVINHEARATPAEVRSMAAELATYRAARAPAESVGRDAERLDFLIEQRAYVVSDPDACPGYWLHFVHKETGRCWMQYDEHPTPRAAIDSAMAANGGNK